MNNKVRGICNKCGEMSLYELSPINWLDNEMALVSWGCYSCGKNTVINGVVYGPESTVFPILTTGPLPRGVVVIEKPVTRS